MCVHTTVCVRPRTSRRGRRAQCAVLPCDIYTVAMCVCRALPCCVACVSYVWYVPSFVVFAVMCIVCARVPCYVCQCRPECPSAALCQLLCCERVCAYGQGEMHREGVSASSSAFVSFLCREGVCAYVQQGNVEGARALLCRGGVVSFLCWNRGDVRLSLYAPRGELDDYPLMHFSETTIPRCTTCIKLLSPW